MPTPPPNAALTTTPATVSAATFGPTPSDPAGIASAPADVAPGRPSDVAPGRELPSAPVRLTVRYFAGARAAVNGVSTEPAEAGSLDELTQLLADRHGERLALVLKAASFLVNGLTCHDRQAPLPAGAIVDILPPFAGG